MAGRNPRLLGVDKAMLPKIHNSGEVMRTYGSTIVVTGEIDQIAGAIGAGIVKNGVISEMTGTTMAIFVPSSKISPYNPQNKVPCHVNFDSKYCLLPWAPMVLWGLCGWVEGDRLVTTADQAGTTAPRKTLYDLGYTFQYIYDIIVKPTNSKKVAASAAAKLRSAKVGVAGYRDMNLYGTLYDGASLKKVVGIEIETFEMLDIDQRYEKLPMSKNKK